MASISLEERVEKVEKSLADLQRHFGPQPPADIRSIVGTMNDYPEFDSLTAFGKYIRRTGELPPNGWKPGDPIPEPEE